MRSSYVRSAAGAGPGAQFRQLVDEPFQLSLLESHDGRVIRVRCPDHLHEPGGVSTAAPDATPEPLSIYDYE